MRNRTYFTSVTEVGNVGAGEDNLITCTVFANMIGANEEGFEFKLAGSGANNANSKVIKIYFGATLLLTFTLPTSVAVDWVISGGIMRDGSTTTAKAWAMGVANNTTLATKITTTITDNQATDLTFKATGTATNDNDIIQELMVLQPIRPA